MDPQEDLWPQLQTVWRQIQILSTATTSHLSHSPRATTTDSIPQPRPVLSGRFDPRVDRHNLPDRIFLPSILPGLIRDMSGEIYGRWMKGNEWAPRPISAKTAPVSTNRAVNFGYRAILLFCQRRV